MQLGQVVHLAREHRKRRLHRLDKGRIGQARRDRAAVVGVELDKRQVRFGADLFEHPAGVQLVLAGDHGLGRGPGQAGTLGDERGCQCAELLVMRDHARPPAAPGQARLRIGKAIEVKSDEPRVAGEREEVEAGMVELEVGSQRPGSDLIPIVGKQRSDARPARHRSPPFDAASRRPIDRERVRGRVRERVRGQGFGQHQQGLWRTRRCSVTGEAPASASIGSAQGSARQAESLHRLDGCKGARPRSRQASTLRDRLDVA